VRHPRLVRTWLLPATGGLLLGLGTIWALQGAGLLGGSAMTGQRLWLVIGLIAVAAGARLIWAWLAARGRS
jgi:hypothetical protein